MSKIRVGFKVYCIKTYDDCYRHPGVINLEGKIYNITIIDNCNNKNWQTDFFDTKYIQHIYVESEPGLTFYGSLGFNMPGIENYIYPQFYDHFIFLKESRKLKLKKLSNL